MRKLRTDGKHQYITSIIGGSLRERNPSKGTVKTKTIELMAFNKKKESMSTKGPERPIIELRNSEKIWGIPNRVFSLFIITIIANFDVSWVLIDGGGSSDIMYSDIFEKMGLKNEKLWHYNGLTYSISTTQ